VGPRAGVEAIARRKISYQCSCQELNPGRPARSLVTVLTEQPHYNVRALIQAPYVLNCIEIHTREINKRETHSDRQTGMTTPL